VSTQPDKGRGIHVSTDAWPVVYVAFPDHALARDDIDAYFSALDRILARGEKTVAVMDVSRVRSVPPPSLLRHLESWMEKNRDAMQRRHLGTFTIAKNRLWRGIITWVIHQRKARNDDAVVASAQEALEKACERLRSHGVPFDEGQVSRLLLLDKGVPPRGIERSAGGLDDEKRALAELVMASFSAPAFLVAGDGEVVFMNAAATDAYRQAPPWVAQAIHEGHGALKSLCRVVPLAMGEILFLVVPTADLIEASAAPSSETPLELPESLMKVAIPLARGHSDREISELTGLSHSTVRTYVRRIFKRTGVHGRGPFIHRFGTQHPPHPSEPAEG
jgi:hypothetical protein